MPFCVVSSKKKTSKKIDQQIKIWMKEFKSAIQVLLLGAGESGKTTIIKQMKVLHINGFTDDEKKEKIVHIKNNILETITTLVQQMKNFKIPLDSKINQEYFDYIDQIDTSSDYTFPPEFFIATSKLWTDRGIRRVYEMQDRFQLIDCAQYFLNRIDYISRPEYIPTVKDILYCRHRTTDIQKIEFEIQLPKKYGKRSQSFWMFDVGGQRGERKKWMQVFDGVHAVLFLVSASCFDLVIREDDFTNRLTESLNLFECVWESRFLKHAGFILFLNKQDILKEKVQSGKKIMDYFPNYINYELNQRDKIDGEDSEYLKTRCFIRDMFLEITHQVKPVKPNGGKISIVSGMSFQFMDEAPRDCYSHFTTATDTQNIAHVFNDVQNMIMMSNLKEIGIE